MRKSNIIFHSIVLVCILASLIINFSTLSMLKRSSNHANKTTINETSDVYPTMYDNSTEDNRILTSETIINPINVVIENNSIPLSITRGGKYPFILKDKINNTYITAECIDISDGAKDSKEYSFTNKKYNVIDYCTSQEKATVFSGNYEMVEYTINGIKEGRYQLIGVDAR